MLCAVRVRRFVIGITTGLIPSAATAGMLLGFGMRLGAAARVFEALGLVLARVAGTRASTPVVATALGVLLQLSATLACGIAYASLIENEHDHHIAWAIALGAAMAAAAFIIVRTFGGSIALVLTPGNLVALGVVIAITLPIGMRFAPSRV